MSSDIERKKPVYGTPVALSAEDQSYLEKYLRDLEALAVVGEGARMTHLLSEAALMAADMNCAELPLPDLIQEASMAVFLASEEASFSDSSDSQVLAGVREAIGKAILAQAGLKSADDALVAKVERLEEAIREINDGEGEQFSLAELALLLDMDVDEIRDILRLTGDE